MQVFVPYQDLKKCTQVLNKSRLGNQIYREAKTLIQGKWKHHPASKMWIQTKPALAMYCLHGLRELYYKRKDITHATFISNWTFFKQYIRKGKDIQLPWWWSNKEIFLSHQSVLLLKGQMDETFKQAKNSKGYPILKSKWTYKHYLKYWDRHGIPKYNWYKQFNWSVPIASFTPDGNYPYVWPEL